MLRAPVISAACCCLLLSLIAAQPERAVSTTGDDTEALAQQLRDPQDEKRRQAVEALARIASPAAWALVIGALSDPSALVADEAQVRLGDIADATVAKTLYGKAGLGSSDPIVQQRVAEALGRAKIEIDGIVLSKHLSDKDAELRRTIAWTIERLGKHGLDAKSRAFVKQELDQVAKKDQNPNVRAATMCARQAVAPFTESELFESLAKKDAGVVRAAATHIMARVAASMLPGLFRDSLESEEVCVRHALVDEFARVPSVATAQVLALFLEREQNLRLSWTTVERLQDLSGQTYGLDKNAWTRWTNALPSGWTAPKTDPAASHRYDPGPSLLGQPVLSGRLAILIDCSAQLSPKSGEGKTRRERVKAELQRALDSFPDGTLFNLIPYAATSAASDKSLVPTTSDNIRHAVKSLDVVKVSGKANYWEAVMLALDDGKVDTIVVVTASSPAGANHANVDLIGQLLAERNRFRRVVLDVLLFDADPSVEAQWRKICDPSGGRVGKARLE